MSVSVKLKHLRISPRKVRLVADLIRGKDVSQAKSVLDFTVKKSSLHLKKLLNSAIAAAKNDFSLDEKDLYISKITVDEGPRLKRWRARARGRAAEILKRTSHITLVLDKKEKADKKTKKHKKMEPSHRQEIRQKEKLKEKAEQKGSKLVARKTGKKDKIS